MKTKQINRKIYKNILPLEGYNPYAHNISIMSYWTGIDTEHNKIKWDIEIF